MSLASQTAEAGWAVNGEQRRPGFGSLGLTRVCWSLGSKCATIGAMRETDELVSRVKFNSDGLVPAIAQDAVTKNVLMLAWMNADTLAQTVTTGLATYWSRSRGEVWVKGATSGNTQTVTDILVDCDGDTLLLLVQPAGPACHTGSTTCFTV